jgi:hypothetical protein
VKKFNGQTQLTQEDEATIIEGLTRKELEEKGLKSLGLLISQQEMKKPEASKHWVIGRVGTIVTHQKFPHIKQRIVEVQYGATCGWHAMAKAYNIANYHLDGKKLHEVSDDRLFIQQQEMIDDGLIEGTWKNFYNVSSKGIPIELAIVDPDLAPMGSLGVELAGLGIDPQDFLLNKITKEFQQPGRRAFVMILNTSDRGAHWYGLTILKEADGSLQFVFVDSAGQTTESVGNGDVANVTHLHEDSQNNVVLYPFINKFVEKRP